MEQLLSSQGQTFGVCWKGPEESHFQLLALARANVDHTLLEEFNFISVWKASIRKP